MRFLIIGNIFNVNFAPLQDLELEYSYSYGSKESLKIYLDQFFLINPLEVGDVVNVGQIMVKLKK